ncbi:hypothetical protein H632_c2494p0 [Helicosporidium sp. ATCC 50920]|nr:hypothetical protein H632_c2494p0 [Helicosporidium sp. ATCC 50920]|eukprot:KDD73140.1 hypothetical protein H632_c2494p0 [Helicosporidium sp. ATCC 50920]
MRLWTQARSLGVLAAQSMAGRREDMGGAEALTLFAHATRLVGLQVVLLGLYNGQKLQDEPEEDLLVVSRANQGSTDACFARVVLLRGKVQGAVLVGDTDLEETFENLIAGQLDVGDLGPALLDPNAHIHEIFD